MAKRTTPTSEAGTDIVKPAVDAEPETTTADTGPADMGPAEAVPVDPAPADPTPTDATSAAPSADPDPPPVSDTRDVIHAPEVATAEDARPQVTPPPPAPPPPAPPPPAKGGGFVSTALGGVVAAAAGYALATFAPIPGLLPSPAPAYDAQAADTDLANRLAALESAPAPDPSLADRITALEARPEAAPAPDLAPLTDSLAALQDRLTALEQRPQVAADGTAPSPEMLAQIEALSAQVAALQASNSDATAGIEALAAEAQARLAEAEAQAAALTAQAEETARKARTSAAVGRIMAALDSGAPFASVLPDLEGTEVPPSLTAVAETGLPSRAALEAAYAPAARQALEASLQANMGSTWSDRMTSFLQSTTGARSLTPREGSHPDAVLSRAEAALRAGDVSQALTELEGLPSEGLAAMSGWIAMARQRLDAMTAAATLSAAVEG